VVILAVDRPVTWRPIRRASKSVTDKPAWLSKYAAVTPTIPAPTTTTSAVRDPTSFGYVVLGAVAVQQDSGLPGSRVAMTSWDRIEMIAAKEVGLLVCSNRSRPQWLLPGDQDALVSRTRERPAANRGCAPRSHSRCAR
jgi:hypothetical protein